MLLKQFLPQRKSKLGRPFRLTSAGWVFILYTIGVGAGAINTGNNLLYLIFGVFLGLIIASGILSDLSLWGLDAVCLWPSGILSGESVMIPVRVRNEKSRLPSICVSLELEAELNRSPITLRAFVPYIPAGGTVTCHLVYHAKGRGWFHFRALRFQTRYPFGLLRKQWTALRNAAFMGFPEKNQGLFVYPSPLPGMIEKFPPAVVGKNQVQSSNQKGPGDHLFGLRDFHLHDNPRMIHWKASARRSSSRGDGGPSWLVRETERDQDTEILLELNCQTLSSVDWEEREKIMQFAAGVLTVNQRMGHKVRLSLEFSGGEKLLAASGGNESEWDWHILALLDVTSPSGGIPSHYFDNAPIVGPAAGVDVVQAYHEWKAANP